MLPAAADVFLQAGWEDIGPVQSGGALAGDAVLQAGVPQLAGFRLPGPVSHQLMPGVIGALGHAVGLEEAGSLPQDLQLLPVQDRGGVQGDADDPVVVPDIMDIVAADVDGGLASDHAGSGAAHDLVKGMDPDGHVIHNLFQQLGGADLQILPLGLMPGLNGQALPVHIHPPGSRLHGVAPLPVPLAELQRVDPFQKRAVDFVHMHSLLLRGAGLPGSLPRPAQNSCRLRRRTVPVCPLPVPRTSVPALQSMYHRGFPLSTRCRGRRFPYPLRKRAEGGVSAAPRL